MSTAMLTSMLKHILLFPVGGRLTVLSSNNFFSKSLSYLLQLLSTVLQPTLILRQVVALTMLQLLYESSKSVSRTIQFNNFLRFTAQLFEHKRQNFQYFCFYETNYKFLPRTFLLPFSTIYYISLLTFTFFYHSTSFYQFSTSFCRNPATVKT
jgi:hypothetical protein